jgi:uncharacterized protein with GYD domain
MFAIVEMPCDDAIAKLALACEAEGSIRNRTLRACTEDDTGRLLLSFLNDA